MSLLLLLLPAVETKSDTSSRSSTLSFFTRPSCWGSTMATQFLQVYLSLPFNASKMQQGGWFSTYEWVITWLQLRQPHWLPDDMKVNYKLSTMTHSIHTGQSHQYGSFHRRQLDEVWIVFRRHCSVSATKMSHDNRQMGVIVCWSSRMERSNSITS